MTARRQPSYLNLLLGLLLFLLAAPLAEQYLDDFAELIITTMLVLPVALGVWGVKRGTRSFLLGVTLLALMVIVQALNIILPGFPLEPVMLAIATFLFLSLALVALEDVILGGPIDGNRLVGAICIYLLLGIAWALLFAVLDTLTAEPLFSNIAPREGTADFAALLYYSLVTLTTLGYGDIAPLSPLARMLAATRIVR